MYESPINLIQNEMEIYAEGEILKAVQKVGVNVDKEELLRALAYDREQYDKGYSDGVHEVCMRIAERLETEILEKISDCGDDWYTAEQINKAIEIVKEEGAL